VILWDIGAAVAIVRYAFRDPNMDLRFVALGAILPNLIDKPIGSLLFYDHFRNGRIVAHAFVFAAALLALVVLSTRRGSTFRRAWVGFAVGVFLHLLLDGHFTEPESFWWPFFGFEFPQLEGQRLGELIRHGLTDPLVVALEGVGLAYLIYLYRSAGLGDPQRRSRFLHDGRIPFRSR
jgi:hypothetical protein